MSYPPIAVLPPAPHRSDPADTFSDLAETFADALGPFATQSNALADWMEDTAAATEAMAVSAVNAPGTSATSTTSLAVGTGSKTLTIQAAKSIVVGMFVTIACTATPTTWMAGTVTAYNSGTGSLTVEVTNTAGSGTYSDWTISLACRSAVAPATQTTDGLMSAADKTKLDAQPSLATLGIATITSSVGSNALTVGLGACNLAFRSSALTSGVINVRAITNLSLTVPSGATLGTGSGIAARLAVLALDVGGTVELAICNIAGGQQLDETNLVTTTAISAGATSGGTIYSATARSGVPYRVVGFVQATEATAGVWATAPTLVQGAGGMGLSGMASLGYGQTWQDVSGSRAGGTTYYNATGRPIAVSVRTTSSDSGLSLTISTLPVASCGQTAGAGNDHNYVFGIVPPGASYLVTVLVGTISGWYELR